MNEYYVSLTQNLCGLYVPVFAANKNHVRQWAAKTLGRMWCSVYDMNDLVNSPYFSEDKVVGRRVYLSEEDGELYENYV